MKKTLLVLLVIGLVGCSRGPPIEVVLKSKHGEAQTDAPVLEERLEALGIKVVRTEVKSPNELTLQLRATKDALLDVDTALSTVTQPWQFDLAVVAEDQSPVQPPQEESSAPAGLQLGEDENSGGRTYVAPSAEALQPMLQRMQLPAGQEVGIECGKGATETELRCIPLLVEKPAMTAISLQRAEVAINHLNQVEVNITFNDKDAELFKELTTAHAGNRLALLVDGRVLMAPRINEPIAGGRARITPGFLRGSFDQQRKDAGTMARMLRSGGLRGPWEKTSVKQLP